MQALLHSRMNYDSISDIVKVPQGSHLGFCAGYQLRRPKSDVEAEANRGTHQARQDWHRLIGPIDTFANANPYHGSFGALTVPFTMKDRAAIVSYLFECKSTHTSGFRRSYFSLTVTRFIPVRRHP